MLGRGLAATARRHRVAAASFTAAWQQFPGNAWHVRGADLTGMPTNAAGVLFAATYRPLAADMGVQKYLIHTTPSTNRLVTVQKAANDRLLIATRNTSNVEAWSSNPATLLTVNTRYLILWAVNPASGYKLRVINLGTGAVDITADASVTGTLGGPSTDWFLCSNTAVGSSIIAGQVERLQLWTSYADAGSATVQGYFHDAGTLKDPAVAVAALGTPIVSIVGANLQTGTNTGSGGNFTKSGAGSITAA